MGHRCPALRLIYAGLLRRGRHRRLGPGQFLLLASVAVFREQNAARRGTLVHVGTIRVLVVAGLIAVVSGCGAGHRSSSNGYAPGASARDAYEQAVEGGFGSAYMSTVPDRGSFRTGVQDMGDAACKGALKGGTRDSFQAAFRKQGGSATNSASIPNSQLDAVSLIIWGNAIRYLCPQAGRD
jgi:hypothetical protein